MIRFSILVVFVSILLSFGTAYADCANPAGVEGEQVYNSTHKVMQYCDGTDWTAMRATGKADQSALDTLSSSLTTLSTTVDGKVNKAGDTMTGALNLHAAPLANSEAATKEYVDTVLASSGSSSGGGSSDSSVGAACYYTNGTCGQGFKQMPGKHLTAPQCYYRYDQNQSSPGAACASGYTKIATGIYYSGQTSYPHGLCCKDNEQNICCSNGFFAEDSMPASTLTVYDIDVLPNNSVIWSHQISGITTATVSTGGTATVEYRLCNDSSCSDVTAGWGTASRTIHNNQYIEIKTYGASTAQTDTASISIGSLDLDWNVNTTNNFGQIAYTSSGTHNWTAPAGITSVSVVCVGGGGGGYYGYNTSNTGGGGGGLVYKNNITVTPGNSYQVVVGAGGGTGSSGGTSSFMGTIIAYGGQAGSNTTNSGGSFSGGDGGGQGGSSIDPGGYNSSGGGGAGGYSGNGGDGAYSNTTAGQGGAGGGGAGGHWARGAGGGGVGLLGEGSSGAAGTGSRSHSGACHNTSGGKAGSGGTDGGTNCTTPTGGSYGAGGGGGMTNYGQTAGNGGSGACRLIWPGSSRRFPSNLTEDM